MALHFKIKPPQPGGEVAFGTENGCAWPAGWWFRTATLYESNLISVYSCCLLLVWAAHHTMDCLWTLPDTSFTESMHPGYFPFFNPCMMVEC